MSRLSRHARKWRLGLGSLALVGLGLQACGPSVQFIYEGHIRFEHCYRLDFDEAIAPTHRRVCWEDWLLRYSTGQTRDRLEYAERRVRALGAGERGALTLQLVGPSDAGVAPLVGAPAPVPTSLHAPPPAKLVVPAIPAPEASIAPRTGRKP